MGKYCAGLGAASDSQEPEWSVWHPREREHLAWPTARGVQTLGGNSSAHSTLCAKTTQGQGAGPCAVPGSHRLFQNRKDSGLDLEDGGLRLEFAHLCYLQAVSHQDISPVGTAPLSYQSRNAPVS